jgi:hypothetical protein
MSAMIHTLLHPIEVTKKNPQTGETSVEELRPAGATITLRRPKAKDIRAFDRHGSAEIAAILELIVSCSDLTTIEAENLDADDFGEMGNLLAAKSPAGRPTGSSA